MLSLDAEGSDFQRESFSKGRDCGDEPDMKLYTWNLCVAVRAVALRTAVWYNIVK